MQLFNSSIISFPGNVKGARVSSSCLFIILDVMLAIMLLAGEWLCQGPLSPKSGHAHQIKPSQPVTQCICLESQAGEGP